MKALLLVLTIAMTAAQQPGGSSSTAFPGGRVPPSEATKVKPEAFRDPLRKVKDANGELVTANLQPLFSWFQHRKGPRPMDTWARMIATVIEERPGGVLVSNFTDKKIFFVRNYP